MWCARDATWSGWHPASTGRSGLRGTAAGRVAPSTAGPRGSDREVGGRAGARYALSVSTRYLRIAPNAGGGSPVAGLMLASTVQRRETSAGLRNRPLAGAVFHGCLLP